MKYGGFHQIKSMNIKFTTVRLGVTQWPLDVESAKKMELLSTIPQLLTPAVVKSLPPYFHNVNSLAVAETWYQTMLSESSLFIVTDKKSAAIMGFVFAHTDEIEDAHIGYLLGVCGAEEYPAFMRG